MLSRSLHLTLTWLYIGTEFACSGSLPALSNGEHGSIGEENAIGSLVSYACLQGYVPRNFPSARCVAGRGHQGTWQLQGYCTVGIFKCSFNKSALLSFSRRENFQNSMFNHGQAIEVTTQRFQGIAGPPERLGF